MSKLAFKDRILQGGHHSDEDISCLASVPALVPVQLEMVALTRRLGKSSENLHAVTVRLQLAYQLIPNFVELELFPSNLSSWFLPGRSL